MTNYLSTLWKAFLRWSSTSWKSGRSGKINVVLTWGLLAVVAMTLVTLSMPDVELELRPGMAKAALLCREEKIFDEIFNAKDATNEALLERFSGQPAEQGRILVSDGYSQRSLAAVESEVMNKIAQGHCIEATHGHPVKIRWGYLNYWESAHDLDRMSVTYQGQMYRAFAGDWQRASGNPVTATQDRAPFRASRRSPEIADRALHPAADETTQVRTKPNPVPPFAQGEPYAQLRVVLLRDGWQPVISEDADKCMEDDSRCQGRPEMESCSGSGLAMCRFTWQREGQRLAVCTTGENEAKFYSICE